MKVPLPISADAVLSRLRGHVFAVAISIAAIFLLFMAGRFVTRVDALRHRRATGPAWSFPTLVYSADVSLVGGRPISPQYLRAQLAARGYRETSATPAAPGEFREEHVAFEIALRGFLDAPDTAGLGGPERVRFTIRAGRIGDLERLGGFEGRARPDSLHAPRLEPMQFAWISGDEPVRRRWVPLRRIPRVLQDAVIVSEDRRFRSHSGFDVRGGLRALLANLRAGGVRQGGSTITQQLARGLFLGRERRFSRKLTELRLAIGLELLLSKEQILEMYLNSVYFGQRDGLGIAGAEEGARAYFGMPVDSLTLDQAALLACVIPAPNAFSPWRDPERVRRRRDRLLDAMAATLTVTVEAAAAAKRRPVVVSNVAPVADRFPSVVGRVHDELKRVVSLRALEGHGYAVLTHVDAVWQSLAEQGMSETIDRLDRGASAAEPLQGALALLEPSTGRIRALVGSRDPVAGAYDYALDSKRQPGSAAKPFVYATALTTFRSGPRMTPASTIPDLPRTFRSGEQSWQPRNHDGRYHGLISLAMALARSQNLATIHLVEALHPAAVARTFERFGLGRPPSELGIGLGTHEVNLLDLTAAYAAFPAGGLRQAPVAIRSVFDAEGRNTTPRHRAAVRAIDETTAAEMVGMLQIVVEAGTARPLRWQHGFDRPCAGKTGTTNEQRDAWFVGFTPDLVAGVWVGYPTPRTIGRSGGGAAMPIWGRLMRQALDGFPAEEFPKHPGLETRWIDGYSGALARADCPGRIRIPWRVGDALTDSCVADHTAEWEAIRSRAAHDSVARVVADSVARAVADSLSRLADDMPRVQP